MNAIGLSGLVQDLKACANNRDDIRYELGAWRWRKPNLFRQSIKPVLVIRIGQHGTIPQQQRYERPLP
jgi:hypothetical protein